MKKMNIRKTMIAVLAAAMCATGAVVVSATQQHFHTQGSHISHGGSNTITDEYYCYFTRYSQCLFSCATCGETFMSSHDEYKEHTPIYASGSGGLVRKCADCGYIFS